MANAFDVARVSLFGGFGILMTLGLVPWAVNIIAGLWFVGADGPPPGESHDASPSPVSGC